MIVKSFLKSASGSLKAEVKVGKDMTVYVQDVPLKTKNGAVNISDGWQFSQQKNQHIRINAREIPGTVCGSSSKRVMNIRGF